MKHLLRIRGVVAFVTMVFLNAFVDLGHKILIQNTVFKAYDGETQVVLTAIVNGLILLPFVVLFTPAGYISDRYRKTDVMRASAWLAVALTLLITWSYYHGNFVLAFAMTFMLAMQSAIYSPAKYGYIRDLVGAGNLAEANGLVQVITTVAILLGTFAFSILFEWRLADALMLTERPILMHIAPVGWVLVAGALVELALAYRLPVFAAPGEALRFDWQKYRRARYLRENLQLIWREDIIWLSIIGLSVFWAIAQVVLAGFPAFAKARLGVTNTVVIQGLMASAGIGLVFGAAMASRASRNHIETGLIPVGAIGVAITVVVLPFLGSTVTLAAAFVAFGFLGGLFIVPLNALIQYHAREAERGRVLAGNNLVQNAVMLAFLALTVALSAAGVGAAFVFGLLGVTAVGGAVYCIYKAPQSLVRFIVHEIFSTKYRLQIVGFEHFPESGGVLLLGNHTSWIDWAIVQMASPRPVRFIMERSIYERWYLKWFLDFFGCIPISAGRYHDALKEVTRLLNAGEVVCLFPEGTISRNGQLCEFKHGYEKAAANATGIIVPFYLRGLWGSTFSRSGAGLREVRRSGRKRDIVVAFGPPLPMTTGADELKQRVFELSIAAWQEYTQRLPSVARAWLTTAKRAGGRLAVSGGERPPVSHRRFAIDVLLLAAELRRCAAGARIGVLLPTSRDGAALNLAVLCAGRTVVNLDYTASARPLSATCEHAGITHVVTSREFMESLTAAGRADERLADTCTILYIDSLRARAGVVERTLAACIFTCLPSAIVARIYLRPVSLEAPAALLFTSGSEGQSNGVLLSHRNIMSNIRQVADVLNTEIDDTVLASLPLFHSFGLTVTVLMPLVEGLPIVTHGDAADARAIGRLVARHRATILFGTSTLLGLYARNDRVVPLMFESLRIVVAGAEKLSPTVREAFTLKFGQPVYEGYGATETTPVASVNVPDRLDLRSFRVQVGTKHGTVGMPLPGTCFRIVDPSSLAPLPADTDGLVLIGGTQVMLEYLDDPNRTQQSVLELDGLRWFKTGDKGRLDADGFLTIIDRYSRFATIAGESVSLRALEERVREVLGLPALDCVAVACPAPDGGEAVTVLYVDPGDGAVDIDRVQHLAGEPLAGALFMPVAHLPVLGSGKIDFTGARAYAMANALQT